MHQTAFVCTIDHKVATTAGWVRAMHLIEGHPVLVRGNGKRPDVFRVLCVALTTADSCEWVFDLSVECDHNFLACGEVTAPSDPVLSNCHHIAAETFSTIFDKATTKYAMGISATVNRKDGLTNVLHHHLGPLVVDVQADTKDRAATVFLLDYDAAPRGRTPVEKISCLVSDSRRNELILSTLVKLCEHDVENARKILVLSDRRDHVTAFSGLLRQRQQRKSVGLYLGGMKNDVLESEKAKDVVCSTYTMFGEGISVKQLNTLVMLTPKSDVCQIMGRIFRQRHEVFAWILDIVDPGTEGKLKCRLRTYKAQLSECRVVRRGLNSEMNWG